jgi:hypothetical protein
MDTLNFFESACIFAHLGPFDRFRAKLSSRTFYDINKASTREQLAIVKDNHSDGFRMCCEYGWLGAIKVLIAVRPLDWNYGSNVACRFGHRDIVKMAIAYGAREWKGTIYAACR